MCAYCVNMVFSDEDKILIKKYLSKEYKAMMKLKNKMLWISDMLHCFITMKAQRRGKNSRKSRPAVRLFSPPIKIGEESLAKCLLSGCHFHLKPGIQPPM